MLSMTGYGQAEINRDGLSLSVEIQCLNSRYFDLGLRLPPVLQAEEAWVRKEVQAALSRGKISASIMFQKEGGEASLPDIDSQRLRQYQVLFEKIRSELNLDQGADLGHYLDRHDIFSAAEEDRGAAARELLQEGLPQALAATSQMRATEGSHLAEDLLERLQIISDRTEAIEKLARENRDSELERHRSRIQELIANVTVDDDRLAQEVAILAEKRDIAEECTRMASHRDLFRSYMDADGATGKRLGFLLQEMGREINTIGSKSSPIEISHAIVEIKDELERMREQVQNVL